MVAYLNRRDVSESPASPARPAAAAADDPPLRQHDRLADPEHGRQPRAQASRPPRRDAPVHPGCAPLGQLSFVNAADQTRFFLHLDRYVARRHRRRALRLLDSIVPAQRWGVARVAPRGWDLHFKGGWGSGTGAVDHQVALLRRGRLRVAVAVMTTANGSHAYGKATLRGVFAAWYAALDASSKRFAVLKRPSRVVDIARVKAYGPASSIAHQLRSTATTQAPNDSLAGSSRPCPLFGVRLRRRRDGRARARAPPELGVAPTRPGSSRSSRSPTPSGSSASAPRTACRRGRRLPRSRSRRSSSPTRSSSSAIPAGASGPSSTSPSASRPATS